MSKLEKLSNEELATLRGRTLIVTGGASGIGKALVTVAHSAGANIAIADVKKEAGEKFLNELHERAIFIETDITSWSSVLNLFEQTYDKFGAVDAVYANAGTNAWDNFLEDSFDESGKLRAPNLKNIEVNLHGAIYCTKAAIHYFQKHPERQCQLLITGSAASIFDTPPLFLYCAGKAGVLGLMRGMRTKLPSPNITMNVVLPWMTVTPMLPEWIKDLWGELPANDATGVAKSMLIPAVRHGINGKSLFIAGNEAIEVEDSLHDAQPHWLGSELSVLMNEGQRRMGII